MTVRIGAISADESEIAPRALAEDGSFCPQSPRLAIALLMLGWSRQLIPR